MRTDGVSQTTWIIYATQRRQYLLRYFFIEFYVLIELRHDCAAQGFGFMRINCIDSSWRCFAIEVTQTIFNLTDFCALHTFNEYFHSAIRQFEHLQNIGDTAHLIEILNNGLVFSSCFLSYQKNIFASFHGSLEGFNRFWATHKQRDHHMRKYNYVPQWEQR